MSEVKEAAGLIYGKISAIMEEMGAITKGRTNTQGSGFKYRGVDDIYNALHELLARHKVFTVPSVEDMRREERVSKSGGSLHYVILTIEYRFYTNDGSYVTARMVGEAMDSGDKASNKAQSIAHKYALIQVFMAPTEDDKDPDGSTHEVAPKTLPRAFHGNETLPLGHPPVQVPEPHPVRAQASLRAAPDLEPKPSPKGVLSEAQINRLHVIRNKARWTSEEARSYSIRTFGAAALTELTRDQYQKLCDHIERNPN